MAISKIVYKENAEATPVVWMDTTDKTADSGNMLNGTTALKNDGTTATGNIQSQAAQTIYPSTSDQTIASGKYLTGAQTIKGVLLTNLSAGNIKKDVVVKVGDSADDDRITSVTGSFEGGSLQAKGPIPPTNSGQTISPDNGYYGLSSVSIGAIPAVYGDTTGDDAVAGDILYGKKAHSISSGSAVQLTGGMTNNGAITATIDGLTTTSYTVAAGYHNGSGTVSLTNDIETALAAI